MGQNPPPPPLPQQPISATQPFEQPCLTPAGLTHAVHGARLTSKRVYPNVANEINEAHETKSTTGVQEYITVASCTRSIKGRG